MYLLLIYFWVLGAPTSLSSWKSMYNCTASPLYPRFHIHRFNQLQSCSTIACIYWKKSTYKCILIVQIHVVQGSTVLHFTLTAASCKVSFKLNFIFYLFSVATWKFKITYMADIIFLLDSAVLEEVGQGFSCQIAQDQSLLFHLLPVWPQAIYSVLHALVFSSIK